MKRKKYTQPVFYIDKRGEKYLYGSNFYCLHVLFPVKYTRDNYWHGTVVDEFWSVTIVVCYIKVWTFIILLYFR